MTLSKTRCYNSAVTIANGILIGMKYSATKTNSNWLKWHEKKNSNSSFLIETNTTIYKIPLKSEYTVNWMERQMPASWCKWQIYMILFLLFWIDVEASGRRKTIRKKLTERQKERKKERNARRIWRKNTNTYRSCKFIVRTRRGMKTQWLIE